MKNFIELIKLENGAAVKFPFELKDHFRTNFQSAKWNTVEKQWEVGPRSIKRLQNWIDTVKETGILEELATRDEREMNEREINALRNEMEKISLSIKETTRNLESLKETKREIAETKEALEAKRDDIAAEVAAERQSVQALVDNVVSVDEIKSELNVMRKNMKIAKAYASANYDEAADRLRGIRDRLKEAGLECEAIDKALSANRNRPDRDYDDLFEPLDFKVA